MNEHLIVPILNNHDNLPPDAVIHSVLSDDSPLIFSIKDFIDKDACDTIIELATPLFKKAVYKTHDESTPSEYSNGRKCDISWLHWSSSALLEAIANELAYIVGVKKCRFEHFQILRYEEGGLFNRHNDAYQFTKIDDSNFVKDGQRVVTAIMYLNDWFTGGETCFYEDLIKPEPYFVIKPEIGKLLVFHTCVNNTLTPCRRSTHSSVPVINGVKYAMTCFMRNKVYGKKQ